MNKLKHITFSNSINSTNLVNFTEDSYKKESDTNTSFRGIIVRFYLLHLSRHCSLIFIISTVYLH